MDNTNGSDSNSPIPADVHAPQNNNTNGADNNSPIPADVNSPQNKNEDDDVHCFCLRLTLGPCPCQSAATLPPPPPPSTSQNPIMRPLDINVPATDTAGATSSRPPRAARRNLSRALSAGKSPTVPPAYPWSDEYRATVRSLSYLRANGISKITGDLQCKNCDHKLTMELDLEEKFREISTYIIENRWNLYQRAPDSWQKPALPRCGLCKQENSMKPVMSAKKRAINWLFLLLGQMLGCCTIEQLKYFCKHTNNHRTGAKDRILFVSYVELCNQLDPDGPYRGMITH